ncbi:RNA polymerase sigma factor [Pseudalkalibacillus sp. SCS-8]|uniref:RNA polymerase sigma factor n=1 Tax=Pseudalkalibacillus nanhaiensis TaxID=3115291 RepID=UPI0032D9E86B
MLHPMVDTYLSDLKKYCYHLTGTPWDGDDLFQDTIVNLMKRSAQLNEHPNPKGYLFLTATNQWRDTLRKKGRDGKPLSGDLDVPITDLSLFDSIEVLIALLPFKQAAVILLTEYYGFTSKEIAAMLGMTSGGVKAALSRGRTTLKAMHNGKTERIEALPVLVDRLLSALRKDDPRTIITTYHILVSRGVRINRDEQFFIFELKDPDGHIYQVKEKI